MSTRRRGPRPLALGAAALIVLTGCSSGPGTDADGLAAYACALVEDLAAGDAGAGWAADPWAEPEAELYTAVSAVGLVGGLSGVALPGYEDLSDTADALRVAVEERDPGRARQAIDDLARQCVETGLEEARDVTVEGRTELACVLAEGVDPDALGDPEDLLGDGLAFNQLFGMSALTGGPVAIDVAGREDLATESSRLYEGLTRGDTDLVIRAVEGVRAAC